MGQDPLILLLESKQIEVELISKSEKLKLLIQWRNIFAKKLVEMNRKNVIDNRDIEIFRRSLLSYVVDSEAIEEYMRLPDTQCVILSSDDSPGLTLSKKPPYDLKRFCLEGARPWGWAQLGVDVLTVNLKF